MKIRVSSFEYDPDIISPAVLRAAHVEWLMNVADEMNDELQSVFF